MLMVETDTLKRPTRTPIYTVVVGTHKPHRDGGRSGDLDSNVAKVTGVKVHSIHTYLREPIVSHKTIPTISPSKEQEAEAEKFSYTAEVEPDLFAKRS